MTALRVLHWTLSPGSYLGEEQILQEPPVAIECFGENRHLHLRLHLGAPLREDFAERIDAVVTRLRTERETPAPLRPASNCLRMNLHRWQRMGSPAP